MREAVIVANARTPLAKSFRGSFNMTRPDDFASHAIRAALDQVPQLDASEVEDVILGCGLPEGPSGHNVARVALLGAGLPTSIKTRAVGHTNVAIVQMKSPRAKHFRGEFELSLPVLDDRTAKKFA